MQTGSKQIERQQLILQVLGFYNGKLDGIWGPKTVEAKKAFERSTKFNPGIPNNGLPFPNMGPYPRGIRMEASGLLTCFEVEDYLTKPPVQTKLSLPEKKDTSVTPE